MSEILVFMVVVVLLGWAVGGLSLGVWTVWWFCGRSGGRRTKRETQEAERQIRELHRRAREVMLSQALGGFDVPPYGAPVGYMRTGRRTVPGEWQ